MLLLDTSSTKMQFQSVILLLKTAISCSAALMTIAQTRHHAPRKPFPHRITQSKHVRSTNLPIQPFPWPGDDEHHHMQGKTSSEGRKRLVLEEKHLSQQQQHEQLHHLLEKAGRSDHLLPEGAVRSPEGRPAQRRRAVVQSPQPALAVSAALPS